MMSEWDSFWSKRTSQERVLNVAGIAFNRMFARHITRFIGKPRSCGPVLEVGTGRGVCSATLRGMGYRCVSLDSSEVAARLAKRQGLDVVLADGRHLPFRSGAFEVVFTQGLLEHLNRDEQVAILKETKGVAGKAVHSVPAKRGVMDFGERIFNRLGRKWPYPDEKKYERSEFLDLLSTTYPAVRAKGFMRVDWIGYCRQEAPDSDGERSPLKD